MKDTNGVIVCLRENFFRRKTHARLGAPLGGFEHTLDLRPTLPDDPHALLSVVRSEVRVYPEIRDREQRIAGIHERQSVAPPRQHVRFLE